MKNNLQTFLALFLALLVQVSFAQVKSLSGTVVDEEGLALPGVNILIQGTTQGTQTDFEGHYQIDVASTNVLVFSYLGFKSETRTVGNLTQLDVTLSLDASELEEVIVMGYVSKKKEDITGSVVQLDSERLVAATAVSVDQALQGKVAGLNISSASGTPGSVSDIRIRGRSSITAGNEPLYVIDGVAVVNPNVSGSSSSSSLTALSSINSNDIESITVLKDASSTAAYGARGANGVIVITTKSGRSGKTVFDVSSSYGFSNNAIDGPTVLTAAEQEMLYYEAIYNDYGEAYGFSLAEAKDFYQANSGSFGTDYTQWNSNGRLEADWQNVVKNKNAPIQQYNISASGGGIDHNFYASLGYYKQEATVIGSVYERISGSLNFSKDFSDKLTFNTTNNVSHTFQDGMLEGSAYFSAPRAAEFFMPAYYQPYNEDGTINLGTRLPNPLWIEKEEIDDNKFTRILSNNSLSWDTPIENLLFTTSASIDYQVVNYKNYRNRISGDGAATNGNGWQTHNSSVSYVFQNSLDYTIEFDKHKIDLKALQEYQENRNYFLLAEANEFGTDGLTNLSSAGSPISASSSFQDWYVASYMGTVSYSFDDKYILNGTYRREGNSRFSSENRWGNFWSVGGAWNLHREDFLANANINLLKLRASYGVTGNSNIALNTYQVLFQYSTNYGGTAAAFPSTYGNDDLTWETNYTLDLGLDFGLFENRVSGSVGYYTRESKDLLLNVPLSRTTGFSSQTKNIGRMENSGIEVELEIDIVRSDDFNLRIGGNLATNDNEVLELAKDGAGNEINITTGSQRVESGHAAYEWYLPTWAGVDPETGVNTYYISGSEGETTTVYNEAEKDWQGASALPTISGGINFHVDFKGFYLDADVFYQGGHKIYEGWHLYTSQGNGYSLSAYQGINTALNRWQNPGDIAREAKVTTSFEPWELNSKYLYDGDFARLRNVTIGYNLPEDVTKALNIISGRVYIKGTNLATWVKDDNLVWDPEVDASGFLEIFTPPTKSIVVGFNFKI